MIDKTKRLYCFNRDGWRCKICGKKVSWETGQLAHCIPKTKANLKKYNEGVIDHEYNLKTTCSLKCNSNCLIQNSPLKIQRLIEMINMGNKKYFSDNLRCK